MICEDIYPVYAYSSAKVTGKQHDHSPGWGWLYWSKQMFLLFGTVMDRFSKIRSDPVPKNTSEVMKLK
jgi:hypothetical protein